MRRPIRFVLVVQALFAVLLASFPAHGQPVTTTYGPFSVSCDPVSQLCDNVFSQSVTTASTLQVQYVASSGHCSDVAAHIIVDGVEKAVTAFLAPGAASGFFDVGPVAPGPHAVALRGEGTVGGCNNGTLGAWAGTMDVTTSATAPVASASAVPALSTPMLWLLAVALILAAGFAIRRR